MFLSRALHRWISNDAMHQDYPKPTNPAKCLSEKRLGISSKALFSNWPFLKLAFSQIASNGLIGGENWSTDKS
jgi:hypothetical protein